MSKCLLVRVEARDACERARGKGSGTAAAVLALGSIALALQVLAAEPAGSGAAAADPEPPPVVVQTTEVFEVERVLDAAGMVERRVVPAADLVAGDELRYLIRLRNAGPARIEAGRIQVRTPVPEGVRFLPGSAGGPGALVEYAVDGTSFSAHVPDQPAEPPEAAAPTEGAASAAAAVPASAPTAAAPEALPAVAADSGPPAVQQASVEPQTRAVAVAAGSPEAGAAAAVETGTTEGVVAATEAVEGGGPESAPDEGAAAAAGTGDHAPALTIRWTYQQPLDPGAEAEVFFHVRLL